MQSHSEVLGVEASTRDFEGHPGHINKSRESSNFLIQVWRRVCAVLFPFLTCWHPVFTLPRKVDQTEEPP